MRRIIEEINGGRKVLTANRRPVYMPPPPVQCYVVADEVADWYWRNENPVWRQSDFGPIRAPFDTMWIEWRYPRCPDLDDRNSDCFAAGAYVMRARPVTPPPPDIDVPEETAEVLVVTSVVAVRGAGLVLMPYQSYVCVDELGRYLSYGYSGSESTIREIVRWQRQDRNGAPHEVMHTIAFMNCRNVEQASAQCPRSRDRTGKWTRPIEMRYIKLPRATSRADRQRNGSKNEMAFHLVRGHFKTYTADAPLFGKRVGTYWWPWMARGDRSRGVRGHTYEVTTEMHT